MLAPDGGDSVGSGDHLGDSYRDLEKQQTLEDTCHCSVQHLPAGDTNDDDNSLHSIAIPNDQLWPQHDKGGNPAPASNFSAVEQIPPVESHSPKEPPDLCRNSSSHDECRVCQQEKDEALIELGCYCRGGLAKAHQSCISTWFGSRGSNKCEICQQVAANIALPESQANYWVWRLDPAYGGRGIVQGRDRGCLSPLWVAFSILIGGLLLDVLISITFGVSALPVNIIIGVIVVLGLGTALRLALEFCHEWSLRRVVHQVEANASLGYHPAL